MKSLYIKFRFLLINLFVAFANLFVLRDKTIWLFGSWMGERFADNSRFLFQYMHEHKEEFGVKKIIWVTRNQEVRRYLESQGYNVYMCGTKESMYWHLKAGVHFVCNMYAKTGAYNGDIDGEYSKGAVKIQLWHGVGIKACNRSTNSSKENKRKYIGRVLSKVLNRSVFYPGEWNKCYWIFTSAENRRALGLDYGVRDECVIIGNYARNSDEYNLSDTEQQIVDLLNVYKNESKKLIIYLPTFRDGNGEEKFVAPLEIDGFDSFLFSNDMIWIEKRHVASVYDKEKKPCENVMFLGADFDVNVILQYVDLVVSDYSSVTSDALFRGIKTLEYIPDYSNYKEKDRGFVGKYEDYHPGIFVLEPERLIGSIMETLSESYFTKERLKKYQDAKAFLFGDNPKDTFWLVKQIVERIN